MRRFRYASAGALFVFAIGCIDSFEPDVGAPLRAVCQDEDSDTNTDVSFKDHIEPLLRRPEISCLDCHAPDALTPLGFEVGGLDLSNYQTLRAGGARAGTDAVIPGSPCDSILLQKVSAAPPFGGRMPLDGPPHLSAADQQLIHDWIAEGAQDD